MVSVPVEVLQLACRQVDYLSTGFAKSGGVISEAMSEIGGFAIDRVLRAKKVAKS
jgi:hypothetical protein